MHLLDEIRTVECRAFAEAWQDWRGSELVPRRSAVRIEDISKLLPLVSVLEITSPETAIFRLAGTALSQALGFELTGHNYFDMTAPETRALRVARSLQLGLQPCGSHFVHPIVYQSGRTVHSEVVSLPVWPDDPDDPPQYFAVSMSVDEMRMDGTAAERDQLPIGEGYQFIDIGAGVPDPGLNLTDRPPATMLPKTPGSANGRQ